VISAHQAATVGQKDTKKVFIPTPNTAELSAEQYGKLYSARFRQPHTYIRSSATVEDCSGTLYCMSEADDAYLAKLNASRKPNLPPITEDEFETIIELYENAIQAAQPYLSMDVTNIIPFEELEHAFEDTLDANLRAAAKQIYPYWKEQKIKRGGRTIIPCLKVSQFTSSSHGILLTVHSLNKGMRKTMVIHMSASDDGRFDKFARLAAPIPRAQKKSKS
jgi:enhancer of polycomb-like protein